MMTTIDPEKPAEPSSPLIVYPQALFREPTAETPPFWTCVYTRPRWEKKIARWMRQHEIPHFLPTFRRRVTSHRKTRVSDIPLFPGYIFARRSLDKRDFMHAEGVVRLIKPTAAEQVERLDQDLRALWDALSSTSVLEIVRPLRPGQHVEVVSGPMKGMSGRFEKWGRQRQLILSVDLLNITIVLEVQDTCAVVPLD